MKVKVYDNFVHYHDSLIVQAVIKVLQRMKNHLGLSTGTLNLMKNT